MTFETATISGFSHMLTPFVLKRGVLPGTRLMLDLDGTRRIGCPAQEPPTSLGSEEARLHPLLFTRRPPTGCH